ncbi:hypothetical protein GJAV_G00117340 [Gymnothorax javanicus]|nr:hypothetical protein GJAV_G00117340 [Gymnothorax javanicus]
MTAEKGIPSDLPGKIRRFRFARMVFVLCLIVAPVERELIAPSKSIPCLSPAPSLMGNQLDRITHLNYSELPTGDPSGIEKDELRVGVAYFFSDEEEELDDRSQSDNYKDQSPSRIGGTGESGFLELAGRCRGKARQSRCESPDAESKWLTYPEPRSVPTAVTPAWMELHIKS